MKVKYCICVLFTATIIGCTPISKTGSKNVSSTQIDIHSHLAGAASSVEESLRVLAAAESAKGLPAINTAILETPEGGMGNRVTLDWSGPIEPLLDKIANLSRYKVKVLGPTPAIPVIVTMTKNDAKLADVLKDAGLQAGKKADIVVYPSSRIIELRYFSS